MERNFCYICGEKLTDRKVDSSWCESCQQRYYNNPVPCVEIALFDTQGRLLLAKRGFEPRKGTYDLPGGFMDLDETVEEALHREIKEELDLDPEDYTTPEYGLSWIADYEWGKEIVKNVMMVFTATLQSDKAPAALDDVAEVAFAAEADIKQYDLSYPQYHQVIGDLFDKMRKAN